MIGGITLVTLGLLLFVLGTFVLGYLRRIGYTPRHMVQHIDRAAMVRHALRYSVHSSIALLLCSLFFLAVFYT